MAILLSFASCDSDNSASSEPNQVIDITNPSQAKRLVGTWKSEEEEEEKEIWYMNISFKVNVKQSEILIIDSENVEITRTSVITKSDGKAFADDEKKSEWNFNGKDSYVEDKGEGSYYEYTISDYDKKITEKYYDKCPFSEYFKDQSEEEDENNYWHITLSLSEDGNVLRIKSSGMYRGEYQELCENYIRQNSL